MTGSPSSDVAIATGAGRNSGKATALVFAEHGARIAAVVPDEGRGRAVVDTPNEGHPGTETFVGADASDESDVTRMVRDTVAAFGRIDFLVNNVAISDNKTIRECTVEEFERTVAVTLTSQFLTGKWAADQMIAQGHGGAMINVGSTSRSRGRDRAIADTAAKGGVANLTRSIAVQLAPYGVPVNSVAPDKVGSPVDKGEFDPTRPIPNLAGRAGLPEEVARAILFLARDDSTFIIGENLSVDGGHMAQSS